MIFLSSLIPLPLPLGKKSASEASEAVTRGIPEKGAHNDFAIFTGKHLCQSFFFNKV